MKKVFLVAAIAVSAVAIASTADTKSVSVAQTFQDTVPGKKDTSTLPKPDTTTPPATFQLIK
ncbi:MAG: hypothetical protein ABWZ25_19670 [Chitinophagaceae bacterium]